MKFIKILTLALAVLNFLSVEAQDINSEISHDDTKSATKQEAEQAKNETKQEQGPPGGAF